MVKIIYVAGEAGSGKSTFISDKYQGEEFFVLDMGKESKMAFDASEEDEATDILCNIYNQSTEDLMDAYFDEKTIVIEVCVGTAHDDSFVELVNQSKNEGVNSKLVMLDCEDEERMKRLRKAVANENYFSSAISTEHVLEVMGEFLKGIGFNKEMGYIQ